MIKVRFGVNDDSILDIDGYFDNVFEYDWLDDEFVREMIKSIDNSEVLSNQCVKNPVLGQIPPEKLSGGVKALICLWKMTDEDFDGLTIDLIVCGENCEDWLVKIYDIKDITVSMSGFDIVFKDKPIQGVCLNDGSQINDWEDWHDKAVQFLRGGVRNER